MQRWSFRLAVLSGLALVAIALAIEAQGGGGAPTVGARGGASAAHGSPPALSRQAIASMLAGSPPRLAALHRQAGRLLAAGGLSRRLAALRGTPVVIVVWASWCPPCRAELPLFARPSARFGRQVAFLGADLEDDPAPARELLDRQPLGFPSYPASQAEADRIAPTEGTPDTFFLDRRGRLAGERVGAYASESELEADIARYSF